MTDPQRTATFRGGTAPLRSDGSERLRPALLLRGAVLGMAAGLGATCVLSICMAIKDAANISPFANPIQALVKVSAVWLGAPLVPWVGWLEHFFIGTFPWGITFGVIAWLLGYRSWGENVLLGLAFSVCAWVVMMVLLIPAAGAGFFGSRIGWSLPVTALILHLIWGGSLGLFYRFFMDRLPWESRTQAATP